MTFTSPFIPIKVDVTFKIIIKFMLMMILKGALATIIPFLQDLAVVESMAVWRAVCMCCEVGSIRLSSKVIQR
jgi:hypothetical protein